MDINNINLTVARIDNYDGTERQVPLNRLQLTVAVKNYTQCGLKDAKAIVDAFYHDIAAEKAQQEFEADEAARLTATWNNLSIAAKRAALLAADI